MSCTFGSPSAIISPVSTRSPPNTFSARNPWAPASCTSSPCSSAMMRAALALGVLAEAHHALVLGEDRGLARLARLEQIRHPRQTAGDVDGLGLAGRHARQHVAGHYLELGGGRAALLQAARLLPGRGQHGIEHRAFGQLVLHRRVGAAEVQHGAVLVRKADARLLVGARRRPAAALDDRHRGKAGEIVDALLHGNAFQQVLEFDPAHHFGNDRMRLCGSQVATVWPAFTLAPSFGEDGCAVADLVALQRAAVGVHQRQFARCCSRPPGSSASGALWS